MQDKARGMEIHVGLRANPTGSKWVYQNLKCIFFADDAMEYFGTKGNRGEQPLRIIYDAMPGMSRGWIAASNGIRFFVGQVISENGH